MKLIKKKKEQNINESYNNSLDLFKTEEQIKNKTKSLTSDWVKNITNYIADDIKGYEIKNYSTSILKNSNFTKVYQSKYAFNFIKNYSNLFT